jgi:hypothetical protein
MFLLYGNELFVYVHNVVERIGFSEVAVLSKNGGGFKISEGFEGVQDAGKNIKVHFVFVGHIWFSFY